MQITRPVWLILVTSATVMVSAYSTVTLARASGVRVGAGRFSTSMVFSTVEGSQATSSRMRKTAGRTNRRWRPRLDMRTPLDELASTTGYRVILGDGRGVVKDELGGMREEGTRRFTERGGEARREENY